METKKQKKKKDPLMNQYIRIYKKTPTFIDGDVAKIIDKDPKDNSYLAIPAESLRNVKIDVHLYDHAKWVSPDNFELINFDRPYKPYMKYVVGAGMLLLGFIIGLYGF